MFSLNSSSIMSTISVLDLPDDILACIFSSLSQSGLACVARACRQFRALCNSSFWLWNTVLRANLDENDVEFQRALQSSSSLGEAFNSYFGSWLHMWRRPAQVRHIYVDEGLDCVRDKDSAWDVRVFNDRVYIGLCSPAIVVRRFDPESYDLQLALTIPTSCQPYAMEVDERHIWTGGETGRPILLDAISGSLLATLHTSSDNYGFAMTADVLATNAYSTEELVLFDRTTLQKITTYTHASQTGLVAHDRVYVSGGDGWATVVDARVGTSDAVVQRLSMGGSHNFVIRWRQENIFTSGNFDGNVFDIDLRKPVRDARDAVASVSTREVRGLVADSHKTLVGGGQEIVAFGAPAGDAADAGVTHAVPGGLRALHEERRGLYAVALESLPATASVHTAMLLVRA